MMQVFSWITLLSVVVCLVMADKVYHSNRKSPLNASYALFCLAAGCYMFTEYMCSQVAGFQNALIWAKIGIVMLTAFLIMSMRFTLLFTEHEEWLSRKLFRILLLYIPAGLFTILGLSTNLISGVPQKTAWGYSIYSIPAFPWLFYLFNAWLVFLAGGMAVLFIRYFLKSRNTVRKAHAAYFVIGCCPAVIFSTVEILLTTIGVDFPEVTNISLAWFNACVGYAMWKHRLFTLDPEMAAEKIVTTMPDALLLVNTSGVLSRINPSFLSLTGYTEKEIPVLPFTSLFRDIEKAHEVEKTLLAGKVLDNQEVELLTRNGNAVPVLLSGSTITGKRGQVPGFVLIMRDNTQRKRTEQSLKNLAINLIKTNRELQDFTYIASHDLQEPLRKIQVFGDYLKTTYADKLDEEGRDYIRRMVNAAVRMQSLIDGLLDYSRITTNAKPMLPVDLNRIIREVLGDLEIRIGETGGRVEAELLPVVNADALQMRQLFQNLIGNALKYHKPGIPPVVQIQGRQADGFLEISCTDNGIGFDDNYKEKIFALFHRLVGKSEYEGSGVGLAICKKIVERHGGKIRATGKPGEGSAFIVRLPCR